MAGGREAEFGLEDAHFIQIYIYDGLFHLGKAEFGGLDAVPVGNIDDINLAHIIAPRGYLDISL